MLPNKVSEGKHLPQCIFCTRSHVLSLIITFDSISTVFNEYPYYYIFELRSIKRYIIIIELSKSGPMSCPMPGDDLSFSCIELTKSGPTTCPMLGVVLHSSL
ncbi:hypothetical protein L6452_13144 [Arctium lappa]|uniref:Uncharacterized protein n=1 Tax=Arctium lappa TaxID=4217 RepID=A0ACB9CHC5_ARCLA|nr:hypothetical protein L6452_13144 [Arctium lappa]